MLLTLALVLALYAAIAIGVIALLFSASHIALYVIIVTGAVIAATSIHAGGATNLILRAVGVESGEDAERPRAIAERLAMQADVPVPSVYVMESAAPNAFTAGLRRDGAVIVVTDALLDSLDDRELEAVIAHEVAHIANRDAGVMTFASVPRMIGETLVSDQSNLYILFFFIWPLGLPLLGVGSILTLALSRYREFAADRGSALLTGRPQDLMSALQRIDGVGHAIPNADLRGIGRAEALCIVASGGTRFALLRDHPPLEQRLARLAAMAREQGEAVGP